MSSTLRHEEKPSAVNPGGPELLVYTDGGCSGNPGPGGWAYVILAASNEKGELELCAEESGGEPETTNNRMELLAVISALKRAELLLNSDKNNPPKITVYTDSQYVQKGITRWIENWKRNAWKTSGKQPVKNRDLWLELDSATRNLPLDWRWVKGHAGNEYNERCDAMVRKVMNGSKSLQNRK